MPTEAHTRKVTYQSVLGLMALGAATLGALWWMKQISPSAVRVVTPLIMIAVMACTVLLARRVQGTLDEVQIASQAAANYKGTGIGGMAALALLMLPPVVNGLTDLIYMLINASPDVKDRAAIQVALCFGAIIVMLIQTFVTLIAALIWWRRAGAGGGQD